MKESAPDDIGRLLQQVDLDRKAYKVFRGGGARPLPPSPDAPRIQANAYAVHPWVCDETEQQSPGLQRLSAILAHESGEARSRESWAALDFVFDPARSADRCAARPIGSRMPVPASSFLASAGGVGVSTISASLARLASLGGQRVLLLDTHSTTLLPMYFGGRPQQAGLSTFVSPNSLGDSAACRGVVHIGSQRERGPEGSAWEHIESLAPDCDRIFLDAPEERDWDSIGSFSRETARVLVLIPDIRCVLGLQHLEEARCRADAGSLLSPYLLLNQFDVENRLHLQIRERLQHQMKGRLIPVSIRRDPAFQDALASGRTIVDHSPRSAAANDLRELEDWLRHEWERRTVSERRETVNHL